MPKYKDNRHSRAVKVSLNKIFGNTSSLNKELATLITDFSHTSRLTGGSYMVSSDLKIFVVQRLLSNHWCLGWFTDSKIAFVGATVKYVLNFLRISENVSTFRLPNIQVFQSESKHFTCSAKKLFQ